MALTQEERGQLRAEVITAVSEAIATQQKLAGETLWPDEETRRAHHRYIAEWIKRQENRRLFWSRVKGNVVVAVVMSTFSGIGWLGLWIWGHLPDGGP